MFRSIEIDLLNQDFAQLVDELEAMVADGRVDQEELRRMAELPVVLRGMLLRGQKVALSMKVAMQALRLGYEETPDRHLALAMEEQRRNEVMYRYQVESGSPPARQRKRLQTMALVGSQGAR